MEVIRGNITFKGIAAVQTFPGKWYGMGNHRTLGNRRQGEYRNGQGIWRKIELSLVGVRRAEYGSRQGVTQNAMTGERMSDNIINKIHHYSGKIVLKSAIKIAKLIF